MKKIKLSNLLVLACLVQYVSCAALPMRFNGEAIAVAPYTGGTLSLTMVRHGGFWRITNKFSNTKMTIHWRSFHIISNGKSMDFWMVDEYGHPLPYRDEMGVKGNVIYFDVNIDNYNKGDKVEIIVDDGFVNGFKTTNWEISIP